MGSSIRVARLVSLSVGFIFVMAVFAILVGLVGVLLGFMISVVFSEVLRVLRVALELAPVHAAVPGRRVDGSLGFFLGFFLADTFTCSWARAFPRWRLDGGALFRRCWLRPAELRYCMLNEQILMGT